MYYGVANRFIAVLDVPGERIQSVGEPVVDGTLFGRSYTHRVPVVVGTETVEQIRKRIYQRVYGT